jgi:hypothetical protein
MSKEAIDFINLLPFGEKRDWLVKISQLVDSGVKPEGMDDVEWASYNSVAEHYRKINVLPPKDQAAVPSSLERVGRGFTDFGEGISDLTGVRVNTDNADGSGNVMSLMTDQEGEQYRKDAYEERELYAKGAGDGIDGYRMLGNALPYVASGAAVGAATPLLLPAAARTAVASMAPQLTPAASGLLKSAMYSGMGGATEGYLSLPQADETRGGNALTGGALATLMGPAFHLGGKGAMASGLPQKARRAIEDLTAGLAERGFYGIDNFIPDVLNAAPKSVRGKVDKFFRRELANLRDTGDLPGGDIMALRTALIGQATRGEDLNLGRATREAQITTLPGNPSAPGGVIRSPETNLPDRRDIVATEGYVAGGTGPASRELGNVPDAIINGLNKTIDDIGGKVGKSTGKTRNKLGKSIVGKVRGRITELDQSANKALTDLAESDPKALIGTADFTKAWTAIQAQYSKLGLPPGVKTRIDDLLPGKLGKLKKGQKRRVRANRDQLTVGRMLEMRRLLTNELRDATRSNTRDALEDTIKALDNSFANYRGKFPELAQRAYDAALESSAFRNAPLNRTILTNSNPQNLFDDILDHSPDEIAGFLSTVGGKGAGDMGIRNNMAGVLINRIKAASGNDINFSAEKMDTLMEKIGRENVTTMLGKQDSQKLTHAIGAGKTLETNAGSTGGSAVNFGGNSTLTQAIEPLARIPGFGFGTRVAQTGTRLGATGKEARLIEEAAARTLRGGSPLPDVPPAAPAQFLGGTVIADEDGGADAEARARQSIEYLINQAGGF